MNPIEVGKMLEVERRVGAGVSTTFAIELAYIMERYGGDTLDDSTQVLELYLTGAKSIALAVSFAERSTEHASMLWQTLIEFCLGTATDKTLNQVVTQENGSLFGSLLEAAALSGADLAHLVKQIPHGMAVEGLRPRLVAAVVDYRLKLQMHESARAIAVAEKIDLLRESSHRSRRGMLLDISMLPKKGIEETAVKETITHRVEILRPAAQSTLLPATRPRQRQDRYRLAYSIPIR
jgi:vacuolar protein sorting-associated protein 41